MHSHIKNTVHTHASHYKQHSQGQHLYKSGSFFHLTASVSTEKDLQKCTETYCYHDDGKSKGIMEEAKLCYT